MSESLSCPECTGPRDHKAMYCPFCGAVFSQLESEERPAQAPRAMRGSDEVPPSEAINPYRPPASAVTPPARRGRLEETEIEIPKDILKKIRNAWIAAVVLGLLTMVAVSFTVDIQGAVGVFVTALLIFGLAYGIYRKSHVCAILLLLYYVGSKIYIWSQIGSPRGLAVSLLFMYLFGQGVLATSEYDRFKNL